MMITAIRYVLMDTIQIEPPRLLVCQLGIKLMLLEI